MSLKMYVTYRNNTLVMTYDQYIKEKQPFKVIRLTKKKILHYESCVMRNVPTLLCTCTKFILK